MATQSKENDKVVTNIRLEASASDPAKAKQAVEIAQEQLKSAIDQGRREEKLVPLIKPLVDFAETIRLDVNGGKATLNGSMRDVPMLPAMMMSETLGRTAEPRRNP